MTFFLRLKELYVPSSTREFVVSVCCALVFSSMLVLGYITHHDVAINVSLTILFVISGALILFLILIPFWRFTDYWSAKAKRRVERRKENLQKSSRFDRLLSKPWIWLLFGLIIFVCWTPVWLAAWPGFFCYDATIVYDGYTAGTIDPNHSLLQSVFLSGSINIGIELFDSANYGIALFVGCSAIFIIAVMASSTRALHLLGAHPVFIFGSLAYYSLSPLIAMLSLCTVKDVWIATLLLLVFIRLFLVFRPSPSSVSPPISSLSSILFYSS